MVQPGSATLNSKANSNAGPGPGGAHPRGTPLADDRTFHRDRDLDDLPACLARSRRHRLAAQTVAVDAQQRRLGAAGNGDARQLQRRVRRSHEKFRGLRRNHAHPRTLRSRIDECPPLPHPCPTNAAPCASFWRSSRAHISPSPTASPTTRPGPRRRSARCRSAGWSSTPPGCSAAGWDESPRRRTRRRRTPGRSRRSPASSRTST